MSNGLPDNRVFAVYEYPEKQQLWVAGSGGIIIIDQKGKVLKVLNQESGLPTESIFDIVSDDEGYVWLPTNIGIGRASKKEIEDYVLNQESGLPTESIFDIGLV